MAIQIEKISDTQIWIHDGVTNIMEIDTTDGVRINGAFKIGTDLISPSASELAAINGLTSSAAELNILDGVTKTTAQINALVVGVAGGYKIARSAAPVALDNTNPTSVAHGLTTCVAAFAQLAGATAPGAGTSVLACVINGANIDVYGFMPTGAALTALIGSTATETFHWFAIGV